MSRKLYLTKYNYIIFAVGLGLLVLGFYFMSIGPHDSFWSLTLAPVIIIFSLVIVFPYGIMKNFKKVSEKKEKKLDNPGK
jgi:glucan phosphoethanolaminetransferase (alkaline phosphatase superfamily)